MADKFDLTINTTHPVTHEMINDIRRILTLEKQENAMKVEFVFTLDQKVVTPFGETGIITMLGYDDGGKHYHVKTKENSTWWKESLLIAANKDV